MPNVLTAVIPKLLAQGLLALRQDAVMPKLVNRRYETLAGTQGSSIDVPIPSAIASVTVAPANIAPNPGDLGPTSVNVPLDQWEEAAFQLSDKERMEVMAGTIPMQASEAIKVLANKVDVHILSQYIEIYGFHGTAGVTPFAAGTRDATQTRKILNRQLAPKPDRHFVLDPDAEANALELRAFQDLSWNGDIAGLREGQINRRFGFDWWSDQNMVTHITGTLVNGSAQHAAQLNGSHALGATTVNIDSTTLTGTVVKGDVFTIAGHAQSYVVTNGPHTASANAISGITIAPPLQVGAIADNTIVTFKDTHVVNLAFHRDYLAFATRPLEDEGENIASAVDPISGLTLRLEAKREYKRMRWSYDILWGAKVVRPQLACRLAG